MMPRSEGLDYSALNWVKKELDETIRQSRRALEAFVENTSDASQLQFCATYLHQARGTLQMVEVDGAALLAEELEGLGRALLDGTVERRDEAYEVLMRGILQLPDYLDHVQAGHPDVPIVLLPLLNDVRALRGEPLLSESALFNPDLTVSVPPPREREAFARDSGELRRLLCRLRHDLQLGLLGWYRERDPEGGLDRILAVIEHLDQVTRLEPVRRLWWVSAGLVEALRAGALEASVSVKLLLGQVDRRIKRLIDGGEAGLAAELPPDLLRNLLYYVARAADGGERVRVLKDAFELERLLPREALAGGGGIMGPGIDSLRAVSEAVKEDLTTVKDGLDLYVRSEPRDPEDLARLPETLRRVADTFGMLGLGTPRRIAQEQAKRVQAIVEGDADPSDEEFTEIAGAILQVEASLDQMASGSGVSDGDTGDGAGEEAGAPSPVNPGRISDSEFRLLMLAMAREAAEDVARVKGAVLAYLQAPRVDPETGPGGEAFAEVPRLLAELKGSFQILNLPRAAGSVQALADYMATGLTGGVSAPETADQEALAEVIAGIEYYLEAVVERRRDREAILDRVEDGLRRLGAPSDPAGGGDGGLEPVPGTEGDSRAPKEPTGAQPDTDLQPAEAATPDAAVPEDERNQGAEREEADREPAYEPGSVWSPETALVPEQGLEGGSEPEPETKPDVGSEADEESEAPVAVERAVGGGGLPPVRAEEVDPEILEIFIEEADEELASLREQLPRWRAQPQDREVVGTIRRSFHTLKGSGRLSGALRVGEFAWALEGLLNRVLDGSAVPDEATFGVVGEAIEQLPGLIGELRGGDACAVIEVVALMERAEALARGEATAEEAAHRGSSAEAASVSDAGANSALEVDSESPLEEGPAPDPTLAPGTGDLTGREESDAAAGGEALRIADPVLYETFSQEVHDHLTTIDDFVARCDGQEGPGCRITEELVRAFHTLHGSAHMAGVPEIAEVAGTLEKLAQLPAVAGAAHDLALAPLFADATALMRAQLAALAQPGSVLPDHGPLLERIERVADEHLSRIGGLPGPDGATESAIGTGTDEEPKAEPSPGPTPERSSIGPSTAAPEPVAEARDELAAELAGIFLEEAEELLDAADETLESWEQYPEEVRRVTELQRELHTLKGGARMADIGAIADLSHAMESLLSAVVDGHREASRELFQTLHATLDQLHGMHEALRAGAVPAPAPDRVAELEAVRTGRGVPSARAAGADDPATTLAAQPAAATPDEPPPEGDVEPVVAPSAAQGEEKTEAEGLGEGTGRPAPAVQPSLRIERRGAPRVQSETVRVKADLLDNLVNYAGEISIYRSRMEQQTAAIRFNLVEFDQTVARLREQLRRLEIETEAQILYRHEVETESREEDFDPLELDRYSHVQQLSRGLAESVNDLVSIQGLLDHLSRESETLLLQQSRVNTEMQEGLMHTRMVPFAGLVPRLRRIVRQTCTVLGKRAELKVEGAEGEMDRTVLDRLVAPMEHMLRNAISHGIEAPEMRRVAGKPETGTVLLGLAREGSEVVIRVCDDGAGIDLEAIRRKAVERGMLAADAEVSDHDVMQFILESGFSTARTLTQISGRGVGMDVVNSEIKQLGGQLEIDSRVGRGMVFTIRLPFTLAVTQALLVQVGEDLYAIPLSSVEGIVRLGYDEVSCRLGEETPMLEYAGQSYRLAHLGALLGISTPPTLADRKVPVLLVRSGDHQSALLVDRLLGSREIVVKSVGPQLSTVRGISGATILGDGRVVLIVDAGALVRLSAALHGAPPVEAEAEPEPSGRVTVMVVDDSITVRKVTARLLERNGMEVLTAKDGVDAVALLQEHIPDIMLLDIEMPRMDGFELATHMRNERRLQGIPIIMITSRTGEKHREHALRIGVNRYLGKPYQEGELIENLHALLNERAGHGGP
jgi:chemosensory pili system protein ChpA (sensor histidine kinase/response regulator)